MKTYYQFRVDGRSFGSAVRETWKDAAQDAVSAGMATWTGPESVSLDSQAEIARVTPPVPKATEVTSLTSTPEESRQAEIQAAVWAERQACAEIVRRGLGLSNTKIVEQILNRK